MANSGQGGPVRVVDRLLRATRQNDVVWEEASRQRFETQLGRVKIAIFPRDNDGVAPFLLVLASTEDSAVVIESGSEGLPESDNLAIVQLYQAAKISSMNSSPTIREVLTELDRLDEPPF